MSKQHETFYVGLSSTFHDPSVTIVNSHGEIVFAEAAERYLQNKRAMTYAPDDLIRLPKLIEQHCDDANLVITTTWPLAVGKRMAQASRFLSFIAKFSPNARKLLLSPDGLAWPQGSVVGGMNLMAHSIQHAGMNIANSPYLKNKIIQRAFDHHLTHAATAAYTGPFSEAVCAIIDGFGGSGACSFYHYHDGKFSLIEKGHWSDGSLGQFYAILCGLCGFDPVQGEEWKAMGLAPYGQLDQQLYDQFDQFMRVDGLRLKMKVSGNAYARWLFSVRANCDERRKTADGASRIAYTGQKFFSDVMTALLANLHAKGLSDNLALGGGCALNSTYNGGIIGTTKFKALHVPSAPADDGCSLGAALLSYYADHPMERRAPRIESPYLGSDISSSRLNDCVRFANPEKVKHHPNGTIVQEAAKILAAGGIIGWMQGRAEFGPRALGSRSILADPRPSTMKDAINARVKFRETFRPFAPAILHEHGEEYFHNYQETPYMDRTLLFRESVRTQLPAVVHENGSGRLQSVRRDHSPRYYDLIKSFHALTGVPVLLNTSFNIMGKPIVHSIEDALGVFHTSGLDALVIDDYIFVK